MSASERLRFGICGLGFMGQTYFGCLRDHPGSQVVAVCDRDADLRAGNWVHPTGNLDVGGGQRGDLGSVAAYATAEELICDGAVDVVAVTLPTPMHADVTVQALAAGKHVICEKPMAASLADCDRMISAADQSGRTLMIAQCIRFWPQYAKIKQYVDEGRIGAVRFVKLKRVSSPPGYSSQNWLMDGAQSGGALLDLHVHDVDFAHYLLGTPQTVWGAVARGPSGEIDHVFATYGYADGRYALLEGGWLYHPPWPFEMAITVCGERGTLEWSLAQGADVLLYRGTREVERVTCPEGTGYQYELDYLIECVLEGRAVERCPPASTRGSIALALLERESLNTREVMCVPRE